MGNLSIFIFIILIYYFIAIIKTRPQSLVIITPPLIEACAAIFIE